MVGLEEAFQFFRGVPHELLFDQMRAVITRDLRLEGGALVKNAEFLRFAAHWGFTPRACRPYRAQTKGKVERPIRYVRSNLLYGREFVSDGDLDEQRERWLTQVANVRIHQTTQERPIDRFEREERELLKPLAPRAYHSLVLAAPKNSQRAEIYRAPSPRSRWSAGRCPRMRSSREVRHEDRSLPSRPDPCPATGWDSS